MSPFNSQLDDDAELLEVDTQDEFTGNPGGAGAKKTRRKRSRGGRVAADIALEDIESLFNVSSDVAAAQLGISGTLLKRVCRRLGIPRWPYKKLTKADQVTSGIPDTAAQIDAPMTDPAPTTTTQPSVDPSSVSGGPQRSQPSDALEAARRGVSDAQAPRSDAAAAAMATVSQQQQQQQVEPPPTAAIQFQNTEGNTNLGQFPSVHNGAAAGLTDSLAQPVNAIAAVNSPGFMQQQPLLQQQIQAAIQQLTQAASLPPSVSGQQPQNAAAALLQLIAQYQANNSTQQQLVPRGLGGPNITATLLSSLLLAGGGGGGAAASLLSDQFAPHSVHQSTFATAPPTGFAPLTTNHNISAVSLHSAGSSGFQPFGSGAVGSGSSLISPKPINNPPMHSTPSVDTMAAASGAVGGGVDMQATLAQQQQQLHYYQQLTAALPPHLAALSNGMRMRAVAMGQQGLPAPPAEDTLQAVKKFLAQQQQQPSSSQQAAEEEVVLPPPAPMMAVLADTLQTLQQGLSALPAAQQQLEGTVLASNAAGANVNEVWSDALRALASTMQEQQEQQKQPSCGS